jgi:hypothetical protein
MPKIEVETRTNGETVGEREGAIGNFDPERDIRRQEYGCSPQKVDEVVEWLTRCKNRNMIRHRLVWDNRRIELDRVQTRRLRMR